MAVVEEFKTRYGVTVRVLDDAYRDISEEELQRRYQRISDAINMVNDNIYRRAVAEARRKAEEANSAD